MIWRNIPGYGPRFQINKSGKVRMRVSDKWLAKNNSRGWNGYDYVSLSNDIGQKRKLVHRIVAEVFIGAIPAGMQVNHKNGVRHDNRLSNLEILTARENIIDAFARRRRLQELEYLKS